MYIIYIFKYIYIYIIVIILYIMLYHTYYKGGEESYLTYHLLFSCCSCYCYCWRFQTITSLWM